MSNPLNIDHPVVLETFKKEIESLRKRWGDSVPLENACLALFHDIHNCLDREPVFDLANSEILIQPEYLDAMVVCQLESVAGVAPGRAELYLERCWKELLRNNNEYFGAFCCDSGESECQSFRAYSVSHYAAISVHFMIKPWRTVLFNPPMERAMKERFKSVPRDSDTRILHRKVVETGGFYAQYQKWSWEGLKGESLIFVRSDVTDKSDEALISLVKASDFWDEQSEVTVKRDREGFDFVNFNFS